MTTQLRKKVFYGMVVCCFLAVAIYEFLTPYLSDDIIYMDEVSKAGNIFGILGQEVEHWLGHTGRNVAHLLLRFFLYFKVKAIFNVVASLVFTLLSLLIYENVQGKKEYDIRLYGFILMLMWFFDPAIGNTVFWEDGACNYLFTTTIIVGFITLVRKNLDAKFGKNQGIGFAVLTFFFGMAAGWCNENTSGGLILFMLLEFGLMYFNNQKKLSFLKPWMISGFVGILCGFTMMILAPGNFGRLEVTDEEHTGILALVARFLKITLNIKNEYFVLVATFAVFIALIIAFCERNELFIRTIRYMTVFGVLFLATCYALIMVPSSELRTYYGASIFLMMALSQGASTLVHSKEKLIKVSLSSIIAVFGILFMLSYLEDGANLIRIKREVDERDAYLTMICERGDTDVSAPLLRPDWKTRFSIAYDNDIQEDWKFWINQSLAQHYGTDLIHGVQREDWTEY